MMKTSASWALFLTTILYTAAAAAGDEKPELQSVTAGTIQLRVPAAWKPAKPTSRFRVAQFAISDKDAKAESAELVVYYFGGPTGGIKANIERWVGQFHEKDRQVDLVHGKSEQGDYILAEISGTWKKPDGPPFAQRTIDKPGSRVIGVILIVEKEETKDYYFLKLSGPDALVKSQAAALRIALDADPQSEKPYKLPEGDNDTPPQVSGN